MTKSRAVRVLLVAAVGVVGWCVGVGAAVGAPGDLDTSFSDDGKVMTPIVTGWDSGGAVVVDAAGRIIVAGRAHNGSDYDFAVVRYTSSGVLDTTFGTGGVVMTDFGNGNDIATGVVVDSQDRVVVAGYAHDGNYDFAVVRYTSAGVLDTSFDGDGMVTTELSGSGEYILSVALDSADRIIAAGSTYYLSDSVFALVRYNTDGSPDTSFGTDGTCSCAVRTDFDNGDSTVRSVTVDLAGRIVAAGESGDWPNTDLAVARYNADGSLDTSFGTGGKLTTPVGTSSDIGFGVAVDSEGRIVVAGWSDNGSNNDFAVVRYTSAGVLDTSFGTGGIVTTAIGSDDDEGNGVVVDLDDRIIVAGQTDPPQDFAVARYTAAGVLDATFGTGGIVTTDLDGGGDSGNAVVLDSAGRIVVAGSSTDSNVNFAVVRYAGASVPGAPSGGTVVAGDGEVEVSWVAPSVTGGASVTDYVVEVSGDGGATWSTFADGTSTSTSATVTGLSNGTSYVFRVSAVNAAGTGSATATSSSVMPTGVPGAPSGVVGVSGDGEVAVSWSAPASNGGWAVTDYVVEYSGDGGVSWSTYADGTSASTTATVTGLSNGTSYLFRVSATNSAGTGAASDTSAEVSPWWPAPAGCTIVGTPEDDVLVGTSGADHICGLGGNDKIYGKAGNDTLDGGPGNDKLFGGKGKDTLDGGKGNDVLRGGKGKDTLYGRGGADVLKGGPGNDKLYGNGGKDRLYGQAGNDRLVGGSNRDKLYGNGGRDKLFGGKARDLLVGGAKKDKLYGGKGKDKAKKPGPDVLVSIEIVVP